MADVHTGLIFPVRINVGGAGCWNVGFLWARRNSCLRCRAVYQLLYLFQRTTMIMRIGSVLVDRYHDKPIWADTMLIQPPHKCFDITTHLKMYSVGGNRI